MNEKHLSRIAAPGEQFSFAVLGDNKNSIKALDLLEESLELRAKVSSAAGLKNYERMFGPRYYPFNHAGKAQFEVECQRWRRHMRNIG